jgi:hypothetical protein
MEMEKMKRSIGIVFALCLTFASGAPAEKPNFAGTWVMDQSKSEGLPADMEQTMIVTQDGDIINQETKVVTEQGDQTVGSTYVLDGKEVEYSVKRVMGEGRGKRSAKWTADGSGFEVKEEETVNAQNGPVVLKFARRWVLAQDGKSLIIELNVDSPNGKQQTKRTFLKK